MNARQSLRSHSPGQNNFMAQPHQKAIKIQKANIHSNTSGNNNAGVFGTNNMMFGNYAPTQPQSNPVISNNGPQFAMKKQRGQSPYDRIR